MNLSEIAKTLGGEEVGGRVAVVHNGKKQYVTELENGFAFMNELGTALMEAAKKPAAPAKPAKAAKTAKVSVEDDLQIDVE